MNALHVVGAFQLISFQKCSHLWLARLVDCFSFLDNCLSYLLNFLLGRLWFLLLCSIHNKIVVIFCNSLHYSLFSSLNLLWSNACIALGFE